MVTLTNGFEPRDGEPYEGPAVDLRHLHRYIGDDDGLEAEILDLFLAQTPEILEKLMQANGLTEWREAAHALKGAARAIGAWRLADCAAEAEINQNWQQDAAKKQLLAQIFAAFEEVAEFVRERRSK